MNKNKSNIRIYYTNLYSFGLENTEKIKQFEDKYIELDINCCMMSLPDK